MDGARARAEMAARAVVLRTMRRGGAHGPCPAGLTSVEHRSKRGGFRRTSTSTPPPAAAHGFSTDASGVLWMLPEHEQRLRLLLTLIYDHRNRGIEMYYRLFLLLFSVTMIYSIQFHLV